MIADPSPDRSAAAQRAGGDAPPRPDHGSADGGGPVGGTEPGGDRLARARAELEEVEQRPLEERPDVFAALNDAIAAELAAMEEA